MKLCADGAGMMISSWRPIQSEAWRKCRWDETKLPAFICSRWIIRSRNDEYGRICLMALQG